MITSREDYEFYLEADKIALNNIQNIPFLEKDLYPLKYFQDVYKFQRLLRKLEYYLNCKKSIFYKPLRVYLRWSFARLSQRLGFVIHPNVFGPGLSIAYPGAVIVGDIRIADNIRIGANSFVNKSFLEEGITIAGAPARKISDKDFDSCYRRSTEILRARIQDQTASSKL